MALEEYKGVYVFAQQVDNKVDNIALELIGKGKALAKDLDTEVVAMLLGENIGDQAEVLAAHGADKVIVVDHPYLKDLANRFLDSSPPITVGSLLSGREM